jgi:hypothetical protein
MTQPNVYWTLDCPYITVIGLYTNVPDGGELTDIQAQWLASELELAPKDKFLILAAHHPVYSVGTPIRASERLRQEVEQACHTAHRTPDLVLSAQAHNYSLITAPLDGTRTTFVNAGAGGYRILMRVRPVAVPDESQGTGVRLESYCDDRHGFLHITATRNRLSCKYIVVPSVRDPADASPVVFDEFEITLQ